MRRSFNSVKNEIEREIGMDEIRRQLHNEAVMEELKRIERDVRSTVDEAAGRSTGEPAGAATSDHSPVDAEANDTAAADMTPDGQVRASATELEIGAPREIGAEALATSAPAAAPAGPGARQDG
jgi:sec-independent protein translocase protein TatB